MKKLYILGEFFLKAPLTLFFLIGVIISILFGIINYKGKERKFKSYTGLVMVGYQGWFNAEGDGADRGWYHYQRNGKFEPGQSTIDMWPDITEYKEKYKTHFNYPDGEAAYVFSSIDESTTDLHFKWMKEYGIDGVFLQRFLVEIKDTNPKGKNHFNKVLLNAIKAANKHDRAISIMYDLSGSKSSDIDLIKNDLKELESQFHLFDKNEYLWHKKKPLIAIWGVGFNDKRKYSIKDVDGLVEDLKATDRYSVMLGVPYYWREFGNDTEKNNEFHKLIKKADIIMPWAVGRYNINSYNSDFVQRDLNWTKLNQVDYVPLVFPGFSWGNLQADNNAYNLISREKGDFMWKQVAGAKLAGAKSLYVAMFDEIDEGTAIFKVNKEDEVPLNNEGKFIGIDKELESDYYLWLTGQATKWFHNKGSFTNIKPERE